MWLKRWPRNCKSWEGKIAMPLILTGASYMCKWLPLEFCSAQPGPLWAGALPFLALLLWEQGSPLFLQIKPDLQGVLGIEFIFSQQTHAQRKRGACSLKTSGTIHQHIYYGTCQWIKINLDGTLLSPDTYNKIMLYSHRDVYPNVKGRREKTLLAFHN